MGGHAAMTGAIATCLWFDGAGEEAANFYVSTLPNSKIVSVSRYPEGSPYTTGSVMTVEFELDGRTFIALNGGPEYSFTPAISLSIDCKGQAEVDRYWARLSEGGREIQCGWLQDKYGLSWQVIPSLLPRLLKDGNRKKAAAVMQAMLQMVKLDVATLQAAYDAA
jgi:predicted 3-demethylubiquinone-9 3-methyltransferase (glyoxalase superfamily)